MSIEARYVLVYDHKRVLVVNLDHSSPPRFHHVVARCKDEDEALRIVRALNSSTVPLLSEGEEDPRRSRLGDGS